MAGCERFELDMIDCLDGALDGERLAALEEHLRVCPACSHRLEMCIRDSRTTAAPNFSRSFAEKTSSAPSAAAFDASAVKKPS